MLPSVHNINLFNSYNKNTKDNEVKSVINTIFISIFLQSITLGGN